MNSMHFRGSFFGRFVWMLLISIFTLKQGSHLLAQVQQGFHSGELELAIQKLDVVGNALYIAAHPDDENTRLITYLANERLLRTAYMSLTRGDGGQNLIGSEIGPRLGMIRTEELRAARRLDGGEQFFSRAKDFGFSKHPDETLEIWDKDQVLEDVVYAIRYFRPDIILTRFSPEPGPTHGHHTASAQLAKEAFHLAADPKAYPHHLNEVDVWQAKRILWNTSAWFFRGNEELEKKNFKKLDVGKYNSLLGKSYNETAAESRTMHKSQGFGATGQRGEEIEYFELIAGDAVKEDIFEGMDFTWKRIDGTKNIQSLVDRLQKNFNALDPSASLKELSQLHEELKKLKGNYWVDQKIQDCEDLMRGLVGAYFLASTTEQTYVSGDSIRIDIEAIQRSSANVKIVSWSIPSLGIAKQEDIRLANNQLQKWIVKGTLPKDFPETQPYWLKEKDSFGMYGIKESAKALRPVADEPLQLNLSLRFDKTVLDFSIPIEFAKTDPVRGEVRQPLEFVPPAALSVEDQVYVFSKPEARDIQVEVKAFSDRLVGNLRLKLPEGWSAEPSNVNVSIDKKGKSQSFTFSVHPPKVEEGESATGLIYPELHLEGGQKINREYLPVRYDHIPHRLWQPIASAKVVKISVRKQGQKIAYLMGAGDEIPQSLNQLGYQVDLIGEKELKNGELNTYDALITGIRAYNTVDYLANYSEEIWDYVAQGGNFIVQYTTNFRTVTEEIFPYPLELGRFRVSVEEAPITFLKPDHEVLNFPNKISEQDFEDWVQERGLYFAGKWEEPFEAILSSNDPGEDPQHGGLLIAKHGEGYLVYSGYSWFRQLPAGVPGAFRIFTNIISLGKKDEYK